MTIKSTFWFLFKDWNFEQVEKNRQVLDYICAVDWLGIKHYFLVHEDIHIPARFRPYIILGFVKIFLK